MHYYMAFMRTCVRACVRACMCDYAWLLACTTISVLHKFVLHSFAIRVSHTFDGGGGGFPSESLSVKLPIIELH